MLREKSVSVAIVNARFVKPIDKELILPMIRRIGKVITIEEHALSCGFGSAVAEMLVQEGEISGLQINHIGLPDEFIEHGDRKQLLQLSGLTPDRILQSVLQMLAHNKSVKATPKTRRTASAAR
jgi:1-deoxy-D-xylulose-5-phosphate synthase